MKDGLPEHGDPLPLNSHAYAMLLHRWTRANTIARRTYYREQMGWGKVLHSSCLAKACGERTRSMTGYCHEHRIKFGLNQGGDGRGEHPSE